MKIQVFWFFFFFFINTHYGYYTMERGMVLWPRKNQKNGRYQTSNGMGGDEMRLFLTSRKAKKIIYSIQRNLRRHRFFAGQGNSAIGFLIKVGTGMLNEISRQRTSGVILHIVCDLVHMAGTPIDHIMRLRPPLLGLC